VDRTTIKDPILQEDKKEEEEVVKEIDDNLLLEQVIVYYLRHKVVACSHTRWYSWTPQQHTDIT